ncbi:MAG: response regulator [Syntrophorhabdales bacterium]|jgi:two-component system response regulator PilR (NtrC family)
MTRKAEPFRILIVDDNREIRTVLEEYLTEEGYLAEGAGDGNEALKKHGEAAYDLIITDLKMPGMTGIELIKEIGKGEHATEFIIITGYASLDTAIEAVKAGAFDYLVKPFRIEELQVVIKNAKDKVALKKANRQLFDRLKSFYFEVSRYRDFLDDDQVAHLLEGEQE